VLSDVVGERIASLRKAHGVTRDELSSRCGALGWPLTVAVLTNIETGRRKGAERRREISIDEIAVIARALEIPPVLLCYPVGEPGTTEVVPGVEGDPWQGARWFCGEATLNGSDIGSSPGAAPVVLFRRHQALTELLEQTGPMLSPYQKRHMPAEIERLRDVRSMIRQMGGTPPAVPAPVLALAREVAPHLVDALEEVNPVGRPDQAD